MSAADTLRKVYDHLKQINFADCSESPELWHQHGLVLQEVEAVLRDGEKQEPFAWAVGISGMWEYFSDFATAKEERLQFENETGDDHEEPIPLYHSPQPAAAPSGDVERKDAGSVMPRPCNHCHGGKVKSGLTMMEQPCHICSGSGVIWPNAGIVAITATKE